MLATFTFYTFSALLLSAAVMVIIAQETIQRALWLVFSFINAASLWISLHAEFLGLILILVYVGAVLTLFLFVIMTVPKKEAPILWKSQPFAAYGIASSLLLVSIGGIGYTLYGMATSLLPPTTNLSGIGNTQRLGIELYTYYVYPFELAGVLLLVAIVVSIILHRDTKTSVSKDNENHAIPMQRHTRVKLVSGE